MQFSLYRETIQTNLRESQILARYASPGAVYRELLQNSNDAGAKACEIRFRTIEQNGKSIVSEVVYRNNGFPFRTQDWHRLQKIAEGNPDTDKVGFFGVGAYAMFSICEEPMVISGGEALIFKWRGDSLWAKVGKSPNPIDEWTSFVLRSRDPYSPPDLVQFGSFLCGNLTFLANVENLAVFINDKEALTVRRGIVRPARPVEMPKASWMWAGDGAVLTSPQHVFTLNRDQSLISQTVISLQAKVGEDTASVETSLFSAKARVSVSSDMGRRIERVTKKVPPKTVNVQIVIGGIEKQNSSTSPKTNYVDYHDAKSIVDSFSPTLGSGRVFIGFKTSQTTGLGVHFAAPLIPTVEREAIDLIDPTLRFYNSELLFIGGVLMRLALEHSMSQLDQVWKSEENERTEAEKKALEKVVKTEESKKQLANDSSSLKNENMVSETTGSSLFGFAKFMAASLQKITDVVSSIDIGADSNNDVLNPTDDIPLFQSERMATVLMRSFSPQKSAPDLNVGSFIARGFESCLSRQSPPVITKSGIRRGNDSRLPHLGIESFMKDNVVRSTVLRNAESYLLHVAQVPKLTANDLAQSLKLRVLDVDEVISLIRWWCAFAKKEIHPNRLKSDSMLIKSSISFVLKGGGTDARSQMTQSMTTYTKYTSEKTVPFALPMPNNVLPQQFLEKIPFHVLEDQALRFWYDALTFPQWLQFISSHQCITQRIGHEEKNLQSLTFICKKFEETRGQSRTELSHWLNERMSDKPCVPFNTGSIDKPLPPTDLYLQSAELDFFVGVELYKVSSKLSEYSISERFLKALGVRETVPVDVLFSQLESLKWNKNPLPLIRYLRKSELQGSDLRGLRTSKYLPAAGESAELFSPSDLCLPNSELKRLGFVPVLQWPEDEDISEKSADGKFLASLGMKVLPPLSFMLQKCEELGIEENEETINKTLNLVSSNLGYKGEYSTQVSRTQDYVGIEFIPTEVKNPVHGDAPVKKKLSSPKQCYLDDSCSVMGFPVVLRRHRVLAQRLNVAQMPSWKDKIQKLNDLVAASKSYYGNCAKDKSEMAEKIIEVFWSVFDFLSTRISAIDSRMFEIVQNARIIPISAKSSPSETRLEWRNRSEVFFKSNQTEHAESIQGLFEFVHESSFLRHIGVKDEPGAIEICRLIMNSSEEVLEKSGHRIYKQLLKRVAARAEDIPAPLFNQMKKSRFLIALTFTDSERSLTTQNNNLAIDDEGQDDKDAVQNAQVTLECARDICLVDDAFLQRMFKPLCAPNESDLEDLYRSLGSNYISRLTKISHDIKGLIGQDTELALKISDRLKQRAPLLISPNISYRPLIRDAEKLLDPKSLQVVQVSEISAEYVYRRQIKRRNVSCCSYKTVSKGVPRRMSDSTVFVTQQVDFFDVGSTIANLVLKRAHLEDSFLFESLLKAPVSLLRSRGFPVDRVLNVKEAEKPLAKPRAPGTEVSRGIEKATNLNNPIRNGYSDPQRTLTQDEGFLQILMNKFADCDPEYIKRLLKENTSSDKLRSISDVLQAGRYPTKSGSSSTLRRKSPVFGNQSKRGRFLSSVFKGLKNPQQEPHSNRQPFTPHTVTTSSKSPQHAQIAGQNEEEIEKNLRRALHRSIKSSGTVSPSGVKTGSHSAPIFPETQNSANCEVIEGKDLTPVSGPDRKFKTENGLLVFASNKSPNSLQFFKGPSIWGSIERFSKILENLCMVFSLRMSSVAIYYDDQGNTIAFNAGRALHFNARYFCALHDSQDIPLSAASFSYWFTVFCHELAHNIVREHGKQHGFYTESFSQKYQPILYERMKTLGL